MFKQVKFDYSDLTQKEI